MKEQLHAEYLEEQKSKFGGMGLRTGTRHAIITGAEKGNIGGAIADELSPIGIISMPTFDVTDASRCQAYMETNRDADVLVMSHGLTGMEWFEKMDHTLAARIMEVNLLGSFYMAQAFVRATLGTQYRKTIVSIGSMAHNHVLNASSAYCASKAGLAHLIRCLGWELTAKGYNVVSVHPSNTDGTPMTMDTIKGIAMYREISLKEAAQYWASINLMDRWLLPDDIGEVVKWLCTTESAAYLSGSQIELPGGQR